MAKTEALLEARGLRQDGLGDRVLGPIDLDVHAGDALAIVGPSGVGKTTLLRALAGLDARAQGELRLRGRIVVGAMHPAYRQEVVYLAQRAPRFDMSVKASLLKAPRLLGRDAPPEEHIAKLLARLGLREAILSQDLPSVSGGEAQRLHLARALLIAPVILLLDEPTSGLDAEAREAVVSSLQEWLAEDAPRALVLVSHDAEVRDALCARQLELVTNGSQIALKEVAP